MTGRMMLHRPPLLGREDELRVIEETLTDRSLVGVLINGVVGMGKTRLAREIHRRRGGQETWLRGDRVLGATPFGVFAMIVDLDDPVGLPRRVIDALTGSAQTPTVYVDNAHYLDERSIRILTQLASDGTIRIVAMTRQSAVRNSWPFAELVDEQAMAQITLGPLTSDELRNAIEYSFGGIVSQAVLDIVDFHSGRNPGKLFELLGYCKRKNRLLLRNGVVILDGLDTDFDGRARDFARIDLDEYSEDERTVLELVVMAGEIEIGLMLSLGLGAAADRLVDLGDLRIVSGSSRVYVAREHHASETVRVSIPIGRSRKWYGIVRDYPDDPSERSRMLRTEWALGCGIEVEERQIIDAAMTAIEAAEWHRALRIMADVHTADLNAAELYELAYLYCNVGQVELGLDLLARSLQKACCPGLVIAAAVVWANRQATHRSVAVEATDFVAALNRIAAHERSCCSEGRCADHHAERSQAAKWFAADSLSVEAAKGLLQTIRSVVGSGIRHDKGSFSRRPDAELLRSHALDDSLPDVYRMSAGLVCGSFEVESGRPGKATEILALVKRELRSKGMGDHLLRILDARSQIELGNLGAARLSLQVPRTNDIAQLAARSGASDIVEAEIRLREGELESSLRFARAGVEALDYWNQSTALASALGLAQYVATLNGESQMAEDFDGRFVRLVHSSFQMEYRRASVYALISRRLRNSDSEAERQLHQLLEDAERAEVFGLAAHIRYLLFRHFGEVDVEAMCRLAELGEGKELRFIGAVGSALRDKDAASLLRIAEEERTAAPDVAARCVQLAKDRLKHRGSVPSTVVSSEPPIELTEREREICGLLVKGRSNAEIAEQLGAAVRTVEGHAYRLYRKLGVTRRHQVAEAFARLNIDAMGRARQKTDRT
ncbi:LuxR C-terminal-related transcriptional regulator [Brevibacterium sp. JSBI002]|uniref:LuxR C-terminal-related transcriptional regulator n=1 Tax=Brevibacterium sp. JSBI002 TaxID=2886045 RepID=UPI0029FEC7F1|nr:LuxR C-terminal-related transcriptional regulator [Brevibacterium sp. JSBI002]